MTQKWANEIIHTCLNVQKGQKLLLITDEPLTDTVNILAAEARTVHPAQVQIHVIADSERPNIVFPDFLKQAVTEADVILIILASLDPRRELPSFMEIRHLIDKGHNRALVAAHITQDILDNELSADYTQIATTTRYVADQLLDVSHIHVKTELGTDLRMRVDGRRWLTDTGLSRRPGIGNLPAGEVFIAPLEDSANGVLVIDGSVHMSKVDTPIRVTFEYGRAIAIEGGETAQLMKDVIAISDTQPGNEWARVIGEFGIGTNARAKLRGKAMTDEKVMGTIHVAIGRNDTFGGQNKAAMHVDGVVTRPTVWIDDRLIIDDGKLLILN